jgi:hypothetical protein
VHRSPVDPEQIVVVDIDNDSVGELVVSFSGYGLYYLDETNGWQRLKTVIPDDMKPLNFYPEEEPAELAWGASPMPVIPCLENQAAL